MIDREIPIVSAAEIASLCKVYHRQFNCKSRKAEYYRESIQALSLHPWKSSPENIHEYTPKLGFRGASGDIHM